MPTSQRMGSKRLARTVSVRERHGLKRSDLDRLTMRKAKWYPATVKSFLARFGLRRLHPVADGERAAHRFELPDGRDAPSIDHAHGILGTANGG